MKKDAAAGRQMRGKARRRPALLAAALFLLAACGGARPAASPHAGGPASPGGVSQPVPVARALGADPFLFEMALDGVVFALPCPYAAFAQAGWAPAPGVAQAQLAAGALAQVWLEKAGGRLLADVANVTDTARPLAQCDVAGIAADADEMGAVALRLPAQLGLGSAESAVRAACGAPTMTAEDAAAPPPAQGRPAGDWLWYMQTREARLGFSLNEAGRVQALEIYNLRPLPAPPGAGELPDAVNAYAAPTEVGGDWRAYHIRYGGALYTLPAPVAAFLQNGWVLRDEGTLAPGAFSMGVSLAKGGQVLRTVLYNFSGEEEALAGCFVAMVESSGTGMPLPLEIAGGVSETAAYEDVLAAFGPAHDVYSISTQLALTWYSENGRVVCRFQPDTMALYELEVWHTALGSDA